ncbi:Gfo/Idh/MocA family oxidoreductase [Leucobacter iarius]|uniref:Gfo/Idh/MocA family oxidoreductase n=1 Tax=Leucobacter iarius TaxID=333963 RepID=A0ABP4XHU4_9MICO
MNAEQNKPLRIAVLSFAHTHAISYCEALSGRADIELVVADPDGAAAPDDAPRGAELAASLGVDYVDSYADALAWGPDAVIVTAENARHRELVELAAEAGAHVLCEKPLATTLEDARAMLAATERAGVALMTAYPVRFAPAFADLVRRVRDGALGTILAVRGTNNGKLPSDRAWFTDPELAGGGALVDHVVHCADLIDELLGARAETVYAVANRTIHAGAAVETGGLVTAKYPGGVIASIDCTWSMPESGPAWGGLTLQVIGTRGSITIDPFAQHVAGIASDGAVWASTGDNLDAAMLDEFLDAVRSGRAPRPDGAVGLRTLEVVDAARRSVASGEAVRLG